MIDFLLYEGKVAIVLLACYLLFRLLLKKENFHKFNRRVLVGTAILPFLLPLCVITIHKPAKLAMQVSEPALETFELSQVTGNTAPWWPVALTVLFWSGAVFVIIRMVISIVSITRIIRQGDTLTKEDGYTITITDRNLNPFSWMRNIVLSREDWEGENSSIILLHEKAHISNAHSVELLLVDILSAFQWFNPAIWMLRENLQELHEYEADDAVLRAGVDIKEYQYLLIRKAARASGHFVANNFDHNILKHRITMMTSRRSSTARALKVLYLLPLISGALVMNAETVYDSEDSRKAGTLQKGQVKFEVRSENGKAAYYINGKNTSPEKVAEKLNSKSNTERIEKKLNQLSKAEKELVVSVDTALDMNTVLNITEVMRASGVRRGRPDNSATLKKIHEQDTQDQEETPVGFIETVVVNSPRPARENITGYTTDEEPVNFSRLTKKPEFKGGGMTEFGRWISQHLVYPKKVEEVGAFGNVTLLFKVNSDGRVSDVNVTSGACAALDDAAVSLICSSPSWTPGEVNGKPVATRLGISVRYSLDSQNQ